MGTCNARLVPSIKRARNMLKIEKKAGKNIKGIMT